MSTDLRNETRSPSVSAVYYWLFAVSGFSGLIYESIWSHYLKLFLGHAAYAQVLVIGMFMGGMAIGAYAASKLTDKIKNPIFCYALTEAIIGLLGLFFHDIFNWTIHQAFYHWMPDFDTGSAVTLLKWGLAGALILPQSILLGATFPLLACGVTRKCPQQQGRAVALLYFSNSLGASVGILVNGFLFIKYVGLPGAITIAALLNLALATVFYGLSRKDNLPHVMPVLIQESTRLPRVFLVIAALTGAASFMYEIAWIRMLSMVFGASTHAFELMLSTFILGLAIGSYIIKTRIERIVDSRHWLALIQIVMGVLALLTLPLYQHFFDIMLWLQTSMPFNESEYWQYNIACYGLAMLMMLPATICAGATLPLITHTLLRETGDDRCIGQVYAANTIGSIIGVVLAIQYLMPLFGLDWLLFSGAAIDVSLGIILILGVTEKTTVNRLIAISSIGAITLIMIFSNLDYYKMGSGVFRGERFFDPATTNILFHKDGKTSTVQIVDQYGYYSISNNGKSEGAVLVSGRPMDPPSSDESTMTMLAALPYLHHSKIEQAANIGFGSGLTAHTLLLSPDLKQLDNIEIEQAVIEGARQFGHRVSNAYEDKRSHFIIDDAKTAFVKQGKRYDAIISEPPNPWVSGVASLFSVEFYQLVARSLNDEGVFVQWLHLYNIDENMVSSIYQSLRQSFPHIKLYQIGSNDIAFVASKKSFASLSPYVFKNPGFKTALQRINVASVEDIKAREISNTEIIDLYLHRDDIPLNSDYYPYVDNRAAEIRFQRKNANNILLLHNTTIVNRILASNPIPAIVTLRPSKNFAMASSVLNGAFFMQAYSLLKSSQLPGRHIPKSVQHSVIRLNQIIHHCADDENVARDFKSITADYYPYLSDKFLAMIFNEAASSSCNQLKTVDIRQWININRFWFAGDYSSVLENTDEWAQPGKTVASYEDSIELKLFLACSYFDKGFDSARYQLINNHYRIYQHNDPQIRLLLKLLQKKVGVSSK